MYFAKVTQAPYTTTRAPWRRISTAGLEILCIFHFSKFLFWLDFKNEHKTSKTDQGDVGQTVDLSFVFFSVSKMECMFWWCNTHQSGTIASLSLCSDFYSDSKSKKKSAQTNTKKKAAHFWWSIITRQNQFSILWCFCLSELALT